ncbi:putative sensor domain DACNV-containing protein [Hufsiella ginkgonis]|uniref:Probable sensor domain-containing protein n=1 Tax=Hufsiella ginkgonis TaxID=2695274 RepID=A0A7K1XY09_9SPHI|nr:hypothetical protein [Hufsiella ginkgonis]MXV15718.1 hypothetical protein [Hufsiella ginkgonis]
MIQESTYKAARSVSATIESHFLHHHASVMARSMHEVAPCPTEYLIEMMIDAAFWASLRKEEGHPPKISLALLPPEMAMHPMVFEHPLKLSPALLTKLAPAVERSGNHLGVWHQQGELYVWGTTRVIPGLCFVLEVVEPGLLVIKHRRIDGFGKFVNIAVLKGDEVKIVDDTSVALPDCPALLTSLLGFTGLEGWSDSVSVLVQLAASMRAHGRGGALLVVPSGSTAWRDSIVHPISYPVMPAFAGLAELVKQHPAERNSVWQDSLTRAVESVAGVTAVDGATVISDQHELLAFGAKIIRSFHGSPVEQIMLTEPVVNSPVRVIHPTQNGGTRHLSAAQFVHDQHDALALVASQDGRFTVFSWSECEGMVHAHRVDALLL